MGTLDLLTGRHDTELAAYRWRITQDHISDSGDRDVGVEGPRNLDDSIKDNPTAFYLYDDDDNCYYTGMLYGDFTGLEPLDDFGAPNAGCTYIKINGAVV